MSVQTHTPSLPPPTSAGAFARFRWGLQRLVREPNPIWIRELRQSARQTRTPVILAVVTGMMTLLIASIGGVLSTTAEPAQVGIGVFHTFFSLAFAVVTWVGPAVAAATIASERSGRTWEALLLTGLTPAHIAQGKFLASFTYVGLYVVMLAPVGGLSFLFGGVTPAEVLLAFALLLLLAALSVAFGLAVSSKLASPAVSILVTLFVAVPLSILVYVSGGVGLSFAVRELWPSITGGAPVWLPTAYVRADFGLSYLVFLVLFPLLAAAVPGWLFYEVTIANMAAPSDDRSTRLRVWLLVCAPLLTLAMAASGQALGKPEWFLAGVSVCWVFFVFCAFLLAGEPLGPSARVEVRWARAATSSLKRAIGPGVGRATLLATALTCACLAMLTLVGLRFTTTRDDRYALLSVSGYALGFSVFCLGFSAWARARANAAAVPRLLLASVTFVALIGPYVAMAIGGIFADASPHMLLVAAPSPAFAFAVVERFRSPGGEADLYALAGVVASTGWGLLGLGLLAAGTVRARERWVSERNSRLTLERPSIVTESATEPAAAPP
jgi:ABC-type transport system involved in multi-copper enzyme maturation permease subunit